MELPNFLVGPDASLRTVLECIDRNGSGMAIVASPDRTLLGVISDGDVRRAMLAHIDLDTPVTVILDQKGEQSKAFVLPASTPKAQVLTAMRDSHLRQIPIVDEHGRVVDLALLDDLIDQELSNVTAIIMAGGFGRRLLPLTKNTPKPMLKVGEQPLLRVAIERLRDVGVRQINVSVHYRKEVITEYFGDGSNFGVDIAYIEEQVPLGTAGSIASVPHKGRTVLVINGDVLSLVDFRAMLDFHRAHEAELTLAVAPYEMVVPYGVVGMDGAEISSITEKPTHHFFINAGVYWVEPSACEMVPQNRVYHMTDLVQDLLRSGRRVIGFPLHEYWRDIGQMADLKQANSEATIWQNGKN